jgi:two-component system chemotaxis response regulator CheY
MATVLVVEDSQFQQQMLSDILSQEHEVVGVAGTGKEGVKMAAELSPELITMDIIMPEMDGIEAVERIRDRGIDVPIVMCTSVEQTEKMKQAVVAGADQYLTKPYHETTVLETIRDVL